MKKIINPDKKNWSSLIERPSLSYENIEPLAKKIFRDISNYGDSAINKYSKKFDNIELDSFKVKRDEILKAINNQYITTGLLNGFAIVVIAIILDRLFQSIIKRK